MYIDQSIYDVKRGARDKQNCCAVQRWRSRNNHLWNTYDVMDIFTPLTVHMPQNSFEKEKEQRQSLK